MLNNVLSLVSIIIPVKNEGMHIQNTIKSIFHVKTNYPYEIIVVDDASNDGCCDFLIPHIGSTQIKLIRSKGVGAAQARNIGAQHSVGEFLIFCDAHVFFEDYWIDKLLNPIEKGFADGTTPGIANVPTPNTPGYGQTLNQYLGVVWHMEKTIFFPTAVLPAGCYAVSRDVFFDIGGFDTGFRVWGFEDVEISIKMWLFGYTCYVQPTVKILHVFRKSTPYELDVNHVHFNMLRMAYSHFNEMRIEKCKNLIRNNLNEIEADVLSKGVLEQRKRYIARRKYNDDWFMKEFSIPF